jgi:aryl-alcohol dehydrogenase-like predicted oxidoreductase
LVRDESSQLSAENRVRRTFDHQENHARFQRIRRLQEKLKLSVSQIVLGYLTNQPFPVFPLIGPKTARFAGEHK